MLTIQRPRRIVVANPHHLGDAVMTFPLAGSLRRRWPQAEIIFCGVPQLRPLVDACEFFSDFVDSTKIVADPTLLQRMGVDVFVNPFPDDELARAAWISRTPIRVGNLLRPTARYCNRFVAYNSTLDSHVLRTYSRHLKPFRIDAPDAALPPQQLFGLTRIPVLPPQFAALLPDDRINLILHPKSGGSGREWPLHSWLELARSLVAQGRFRLVLTGSSRERELITAECPQLLSESLAIDLMGKLCLPEFLALIARADGMVASSTGPLHIAAVLGRRALGIYPAGKGLDPTCWSPLGPHVRILRAAGNCHPGRGSCPRAKGPPCPCISALEPDRVAAELVNAAFPEAESAVTAEPLPARISQFATC